MENSGAEKVLADDSRSFENGTVFRIQRVKSARQEGVDRGRDGLLEAFLPDVLGDVRKQLLDEQGVTLGRLEDPRARVLGKLRLRSHSVRRVWLSSLESGASGMVSVVVRQPGRLSRSSGLAMQSTRTGHRSSRHRGTRPGRVASALPMDVLENRYDRSRARQRLEEPPYRPEKLACLRRPFAEAGQLGHAFCDQGGVLVAFEQSGDRRLGPLRSHLVDDLGERQVGRSLAV